MRVILVGCGIAGAALSLTLQRAGIDHLVLEQASELAETGAGLQQSPNSIRVLQYLGLMDELKRIGVAPQAHLFKDYKSGTVLLKTPLMPKVEEYFGAPYYHVHRADLLGIMVNAMDPANIRLNSKVSSVVETRNGVEVTLSDGTLEKGDVLIGADGLHSMVRQQFFAADAPRHSGCVAWRGLVPVALAQKLGFEQNSYLWMGPHRSAVLYYVRGGDLFNWVGISPYNDNAKESWSQTGSREAALKEYKGWNSQVTDLINDTESLFMTALIDRDPLDAWVTNRVALMGDAAHAMMPYHAQGAGQSIEDAWVLGRCLEMAAGDIPAALKKYETLRLPRANRVQQQSRGGEHLFHMSDPEEIARRNARFAKHQQDDRDGFPAGQRWLFSYDAEKAVMGTDDEWRALNW
ncbi:MAG: FAD-dependent monooxygenase [Sneathiella sp.]|nr:FAD-dependent monooxygenase [Sneathiella sp.]